MDRLEQTALIQIGILLKEFIEPGELPDHQLAFTNIIEDNLGIELTSGEPICGVRDRVLAAIKERDELSELEDSFYADWIREELIACNALQLCAAIDQDIINGLINTDKQMRFDDAMKGI